jgi:predicted MPP superfamily phosphohydrolase
MSVSDPHKRRYSNRAHFWFAVLLVLFLAHFYLYLAVGRHLSTTMELAWLCIGTAALASSAAAPHIGTPRNATGKISLRSVLQRWGAFWNILVFLTALIMAGLNAARYFHPSFPASLRVSFWLSVSVALLFCLYGLAEARNVRSSRFVIHTKKLPPGARLRIAHLTDLHVGPFMNVGQTARAVRATIEARPDIVVITGDLVDGFVCDQGEELPYYIPFSKKFREIAESAPRLGVWAVPGNHEYYEGFENSQAFIENSGARLLRSEKTDLGDMVLIGADDLDHEMPPNSRPGLTKSEALVASLSPDERRKFVLLLRHRPLVEQSTIGKFDLQLSGHTHGGQVLPLPSSRHRIPGRPKGLLDLGGGSSIYVCNGAGFVGPPMRFFAPAEIAVIDVEGEPSP